MEYTFGLNCSVSIMCPLRFKRFLHAEINSFEILSVGLFNYFSESNILNDAGECFLKNERPVFSIILFNETFMSSKSNIRSDFCRLFLVL